MCHKILWRLVLRQNVYQRVCVSSYHARVDVMLRCCEDRLIHERVVSDEERGGVRLLTRRVVQHLKMRQSGRIIIMVG